jgi:hypothetical protein
MFLDYSSIEIYLIFPYDEIQIMHPLSEHYKSDFVFFVQGHLCSELGPSYDIQSKKSGVRISLWPNSNSYRFCGWHWVKGLLLSVAHLGEEEF